MGQLERLIMIRCYDNHYGKSFRNGFTMLEILIVIGIIALLAAMLLPVLSVARRYAWRVRARSDLHQLVTAFKNYLTDYRQFPDIDITVVDSNVVSILRGVHTNYNIQHYKYMEFTTEQITNGFRDPWKSLYRLALDNGLGDDTLAYDGYVTVPEDEGTNKIKIPTSVAAWSLGPDGEENPEGDDVKTW